MIFWLHKKTLELEQNILSFMCIKFIGALPKKRKRNFEQIERLLLLLPLSSVQLFVTPWPATLQAFLPFTISWSLLKLMSVESVIPSNHFIHSPPALSLSQRQSLFQWVSSSHQVAKVLELQLQHQSFQWMFRVDFSVDAPYHAKHCAGYWIMTSLTIGLWSEWSYPFLGLHLLPIFWGVVIDAQSSPCIMILAVLHRNLGCLSWTFISSFSPHSYLQICFSFWIPHFSVKAT